MAFALHLPPLEQICYTQTAVCHWKRHFPYHSTAEWPLDESEEVNKENLIFDEPKTEMQQQWSQTFKKICGSVDELFFPKIFKQEIKNTPLRFVGIELYHWLRNVNYNIVHLDRHKTGVCVKLTKWNVYGKIDERATAQLLCQCEELALIDRFAIASGFCIPNAVKKIWRQLPDNKFYNYGDIVDVWQFNAFKFWTDVISKNIDENEMPDCRKIGLLTLAINYKILSAVQFIANMFPVEERSAAVMTAIYSLPLPKGLFEKGDRSTMHFLLSLLKEEHLELIFTSELTRFNFADCLLGDLVYCTFASTIFNRIQNHLQPIEFKGIISKVAIQAHALRSERLKITFSYLWDNAGENWRNLVLNHEVGRRVVSLFYIKKKMY